MNEEIGEEDEENNPYSLGGDDNSINEERSGLQACCSNSSSIRS